MVVDLSFDRLSQNYLQLSRSPSMFKLFMIADDGLFSCFAPDDNLLFEGIRVSLIGVQNLIINNNNNNDNNNNDDNDNDNDNDNNNNNNTWTGLNPGVISKVG